jgi:hypothetical protein
MMPDSSVGLIVQHYQNTFELTHETWKERNRLFIFLILTTGAGLLLLLQVPEAKSLFVDLVVKLLEITDEDRIDQLHQNFPMDVILSIILIIVFYLMQKLYSTNLAVFRHYIYLGAVEDEIRQTLELPEDSVSFTREGSFYWGHRTLIQKLSKWFYLWVILVVLLPFMVLKVNSDLNAQSYFLAIIDSAVAILTFLYFLAYARSAKDLDVEEVPQQPEGASNSDQ